MQPRPEHFDIRLSYKDDSLDLALRFSVAITLRRVLFVLSSIGAACWAAGSFMPR